MHVDRTAHAADKSVDAAQQHNTTIERGYKTIPGLTGHTVVVLAIVGAQVARSRVVVHSAHESDVEHPRSPGPSHHGGVGDVPVTLTHTDVWRTVRPVLRRVYNTAELWVCRGAHIAVTARS